MVRNSNRLVTRVMESESAGGIALVAAAVVGLLCANVPGLSRAYEYLLNVPIEVKLGPLELHKNFLLIVNDGLMAVFFLLVGLEIKREVLEGELSGSGRVALPTIAAIGGVVLPAGIYAAINAGDAPALQGWAIPAATDIAFSLGVLALLGDRVPIGLKLFLTTLAVIDDLAAIVIIAAFYTSQLTWVALLVGVGGVAVLVILNLSGVARLGAYVLVGAFVWLCVLKSGVHATLAGVAVGLAIPLRTRHAEEESPLVHLEHRLRPWVGFMILPLFAFANAGVDFRGMSAEVLWGPVTLGIVAGLCVGKPVGVLGGAWLAIKLKLSRLPGGASWSSMVGIAFLAGIGFTMSLFIGMLAFEGSESRFAAATRLGVFGGSIVSAVIGYLVLRRSFRSPDGVSRSRERLGDETVATANTSTS